MPVRLASFAPLVSLGAFGRALDSWYLEAGRNLAERDEDHERVPERASRVVACTEDTVMRWVLPLAILIGFEAIADILAKSWSEQGNWIRAGGALIAYLLANTFWLFALKNGSGLGRGAVIFSVVSALLAILIGVLMYREELTRLQMIGAIFGIISLVLISWNE